MKLLKRIKRTKRFLKRELERQASILYRRSSAAIDGFINPTKVIDEQKKVRKLGSTKYMDIWLEIYAYGTPDEIMLGELKIYRNLKGDFCCSENNQEIGKFLIEHDIEPELIDDEHRVCSIGWSEAEGAYYGWSHRAISMFKIGDRVFDKNYFDPAGDTPFNQHGDEVIATRADARRAAVNFAKYIG